MQEAVEQNTVHTHATLQRPPQQLDASLPYNHPPTGETLIIPQSSLGGCGTQGTGYLFLTPAADSSETLRCPWALAAPFLIDGGGREESGRATSCRQDRAAGSRFYQRRHRLPQLKRRPASLCGSSDLRPSSTGVGKPFDRWPIMGSEI